MTNTINIAIGLSANSKRWSNTRITWQELVTRLSSAVVTKETYAQYLKASKDEQGKIKDVGGFVGGYLTGELRKIGNVLYRQVLTLDIDFAHSELWDDFTLLYDCAAVLHATHKSCPEKPRYRLIIPLDREVSCEEYQAIARRVAATLNIELFDQTTFDVNRLMFWPSVSCDIEYYFQEQQGEFLDADSILETYEDWHDSSQWPTAASHDESIRIAAKEQENPTQKQGLIGLFCRTYSIHDAIATFLPDVYKSAGENRYTYANGSTFAGAIAYDDLFLYSHHGTDPAGGRLCNAFDLVRIHKYGHLDKNLHGNTKIIPSVKAMEDFITNDPNIKRRIATERLESAKEDFDIPVNSNSDNAADDWVTELTINRLGAYDNSANNINLILKNDPAIKGIFYLNDFDNKRYIKNNVPWRKINGLEPLKDVDYSGIRSYLECVYDIVSSQKIEDAVALEFESNHFHPIQDYLSNLVWDQVPRVDTLLIDYFGAFDNLYSRQIIRMTLCAACARVFEPGIKYDSVLVLVGPQGSYKSTFFKKLGGPWFSDTFTTVQGKSAFEQLQGAWIIEIAELAGLRKAEVETIKHFISKRDDMFRPAFGRVVETFKRQCVFVGTTNSDEFLRDSTGNRRFLPISVNINRVSKSVVTDLTQSEVDQIWAEAYYKYVNREPLYLSADINKLAVSEQSNYIEQDSRTGVVENYLDMLYPDNWDDLDLISRKIWLEDPSKRKGTRQRAYVCVMEIWCECFGYEISKISRKDSNEIVAILRQLDWVPAERSASSRRYKIYGKQRTYVKKGDLL